MAHPYKLFSSKSKAKLSIVGTPLGNISDISLRAVLTLSLADIIACEDTRRAKQLLDLIKSSNVWTSALISKDISWSKDQKLVSNFVGNEHHRLESFMAFLAQGKHIVLISDSGMPALSDPGNLLINSVADNGYDIEIIPSASAYSTALIRSGLGDRRHLFLGFLPKYSLVKFDTIFNTWQRHWQIDNDLLILCYESPHRIKKTLGYLKVLEIKYDLRLKVSIARELTKKHEQVISGSVEDVLSNVVEKGEMVLIIGQN